jgi:hypothetical protein
MRKSDIETIILQDAEIKTLRRRVKNLEMSYLEIHRINEKLRRQIARYERRENALSGVNT